jgi:hypothetical protein
MMNENKSRLLLIAAIILAVAVFVWVIFSFDDQPGEEDGIGQNRIQKIMVSKNSTVDINKAML